jgi:uncharacterized protein
MSEILITGGSGLVGTRLIELLSKKGYQTAILSTQKSYKHPLAKVYYWNIKERHIEEGAIKNASAIIHLAGASVAGGRWTDARKKEIYYSRIDSTNLLHTYLQNTTHNVKAFISSSAIGIYENDTQEILTETAPPADNFLAKVCTDWEKEALKIEKLGIRTAILRTGIVLDTNGGALKEMLKTLPAFVSILGNGEQIYSWIHIDDLCRMYIHALENEQVKGAFNAVAPHPVSQKTIAKAIQKEKFSLLPLIPAPAIALKIALGEMSEVVLGSQHCSAEKIIQSGFTFKHLEINEAINHILKSID